MSARVVLIAPQRVLNVWQLVYGNTADYVALPELEKEDEFERKKP